MGMTLLEIMIVLAILAAVMGILIGPRVIGAHTHARGETTRMKLKMLAYEAYPSWAAVNHSVGCPASLAELSPYMNGNDLTDGWGQALELKCGASLPAGVHGIGVVSRGEDGKLGTSDDLTSWER
jgi:prepilin-type N-terminal cleavage/methylation domain-containing protein